MHYAAGMNGRAIFHSHRACRDGWSLALEQPRRVLCATALDEVIPALRAIDQATHRGQWAALMLAYEAAPAFDPALKTHAPGNFPLLWAGIYDRPAPSLPLMPRRDELAGQGAWEPLVGRQEYDACIHAIRAAIHQGEAYQVNYTIPFETAFAGDVLAWFHDLTSMQRAGYAAYLEIGEYTILSLSPELFFRRTGDRILARPMKGTMRRGRFAAEDAAAAAALACCPKNQAENIMIVDLVRNDLGKLARAGSVRVADLFAVERYPTVLQMVSTVQAELEAGVGLQDIFAALFPCGSVTGAPKASAMGIIAKLERRPRGAYCGAIGYVQPGGDCVFNVPIRSALLDTRTSRARMHVGGGVTWDSTARDEYAECMTKLQFATEHRPPFSLFETLLLEQGNYFLLDWHAARLQDSAVYFGFAFDRAAFDVALAAVAAERPKGRHRIKLLLDQAGGISVKSALIGPRRTERWTLGWADWPVDSSDVFLFHKTTRRETYDRILASHPEFQDVLMYNERGELTESCRANVVLKLEGKLWTPARESGLLAGTFRAELLQRGLVRECRVLLEDVERAQGMWLINSVRRWLRVELSTLRIK